MKKCRLCGIEKLEDGFYKHPKMIGGRDSKCKECTKAAVRANYRRNIEYYKSYERERANLPHRVEAREQYAQTKPGKESGNRAKQKWSEHHRLERAAHQILGNAIRGGKVQKPDCCSECGAKVKRIEGHHEDYSKPLEVVWLCRKCHAARHKSE